MKLKLDLALLAVAIAPVLSTTAGKANIPGERTTSIQQASLAGAEAPPISDLTAAEIEKDLAWRRERWAKEWASRFDIRWLSDAEVRHLSFENLRSQANPSLARLKGFGTIPNRHEATLFFQHNFMRSPRVGYEDDEFYYFSWSNDQQHQDDFSSGIIVHKKTGELNFWPGAEQWPFRMVESDETRRKQEIANRRKLLNSSVASNSYRKGTEKMRWLSDAEAGHLSLDDIRSKIRSNPESEAVGPVCSRKEAIIHMGSYSGMTEWAVPGVGYEDGEYFYFSGGIGRFRVDDFSRGLLVRKSDGEILHWGQLLAWEHPPLVESAEVPPALSSMAEDKESEADEDLAWRRQSFAKHKAVTFGDIRWLDPFDVHGLSFENLRAKADSSRARFRGFGTISDRYQAMLFLKVNLAIPADVSGVGYEDGDFFYFSWGADTHHRGDFSSGCFIRKWTGETNFWPGGEKWPFEASAKVQWLSEADMEKQRKEDWRKQIAEFVQQCSDEEFAAILRWLSDADARHLSFPEIRSKTRPRDPRGNSYAIGPVLSRKEAYAHVTQNRVIAGFATPRVAYEDSEYFYFSGCVGTERVDDFSKGIFVSKKTGEMYFWW